MNPVWVLTLFIVVAGLPAYAQDVIDIAPTEETPEVEEVSCTIQIAHESQRAEAMGQSMTIEEAFDDGIEGACMLVCSDAVETETPKEVEPVRDGEMPNDDAAEAAAILELEAEENPAITACVERCVDEAEIVGGLCTAGVPRIVVYTEGSFEEADSKKTSDKKE